MPCARPAAEIDPVLSIDSRSATLPAPSRRPASKSSRIVNRVDMSPPSPDPAPLLGMRELPIELPRAAIERSWLQIASVDPPHRRHLGVVPDHEDFVRLVKIGEAQRRFAGVLAVAAQQ